MKKIILVLSTLILSSNLFAYSCSNPGNDQLFRARDSYNDKFALAERNLDSFCRFTTQQERKKYSSCEQMKKAILKKSSDYLADIMAANKKGLYVSKRLYDLHVSCMNQGREDEADAMWHTHLKLTKARKSGISRLFKKSARCSKIADNFLRYDCKDKKKVTNKDRTIALNNKALNLLHKGEYKKAMVLFQEAHSLDKNNGNILANIGYMFSNGLGVDEDKAKAITLYEEAINLGNSTTAYNNLAWMYDFGSGVDVDYKKAKELYTIAAQKGNERAMYHLAVMFEEGKGMKKDMIKATYWYQKAANLGEKDSIKRLGL